MDVEKLPLEDGVNKANSKNNIYAVSTEDTKKESSENMEEMRTEYDAKYTINEKLVPVPTEEDIEESRNDFDICNYKFPR